MSLGNGKRNGTFVFGNELDVRANLFLTEQHNDRADYAPIPSHRNRLIPPGANPFGDARYGYGLTPRHAWGHGNAAVLLRKEMPELHSRKGSRWNPHVPIQVFRVFSSHGRSSVLRNDLYEQSQTEIPANDGKRRYAAHRNAGSQHQPLDLDGGHEQHAGDIMPTRGTSCRNVCMLFNTCELSGQQLPMATIDIVAASLNPWALFNYNGGTGVTAKIDRFPDTRKTVRDQRDCRAIQR